MDHEMHGTLITAEATWKTETDVYAGIQNRQHRHLIQRYASIKQGNNYYLLLEWADGGTLSALFRKLRQPESHAMARSLVRELIEQYRGISSALETLHRETKRQSFSVDTGQSYREFTVGGDNHVEATDEPGSIDSLSHTGLTPVNTLVGGTNGADSSDQGGHFRHGDVKPANILVFPEAGKLLGILKLADLGLAKNHTRATRYREDPSTTKFVTRRYEAPEACLGQKWSRKFDVWSFGCILLETVIWLLYGQDELDAFIDRARPLLLEQSSPYYTVQDNEAKVNSVALDTMNYVIENDPECQVQEDSAIKDLILLTREHLLKVDPSDDKLGTRCSAQNLATRLGEILKKGSSNDRYFWRGHDRQRVVPLSSVSSIGQERRPSSTRLAPPPQSIGGRSVQKEGQAVAGAERRVTIRPSRDKVS
jgi:serine/threonine protein kinase